MTVLGLIRQSSRALRLQHELGNGLLMLAGSLTLALGVTLFLQPNQIASGGTPGMAILIGHVSGLTTGTLMLLINIPLLVIGYCTLGQRFVWRTVVSVLLLSAFVDLLNEGLGVGAVTASPLLAALGGGALIGVGVGLVLRGNASAGGPTILARIAVSRSRIRPGRLLLAIDVGIVLAAYFVFGRVESALWSLLSVVATGRCVDLVMGDAGRRLLDAVRGIVVRTVTSS